MRGDFRATLKSVLSAGVPTIQVRSKSASTRELFELASLVREEAEGFPVLIFVNDRSDVALAVGADGVHVGPADLPVLHIRRSCPEEFLIGTSSDDPRLAGGLIAEGADYVGCGAVFATATKPTAGQGIGIHGLSRVVAAVDAPVVGIGGITLQNVQEVMTSGCAGVAILSGIAGAESPGAVVREILQVLAS